MRRAEPGAPLTVLLLLALALSLHATQRRPRGRRGAHVAYEKPKPWFVLPVAGAGAPSSSRSAGKSRSQLVLCSEPGSGGITVGAQKGARFLKPALSAVQNTPPLQ